MKRTQFIAGVILAVALSAGAPFGLRALERAGDQSAGGAGSIGQALVVRQTSARTGLASFASADGDGLLLPASANLPAESRALAFLGLHGHEFGIDRAGVRLQRAPTVDLLGIEHVRFQQVHLGVPVRAGEFLVHLRGARVVAANGSVLTDLPSDVAPVLSPVDAIDRARQVVARHRAGSAAEARYRTPELEIFNRGMLGETSVGSFLAWFVEATGPALREFIWIDARTGGLLLNFSQLPDARNRQTYDAMSTPTLPGTLIRSEGQADVGDADADSAHHFAGDTYDYFFSTHGRDSYDDAGAMLISTVRYCPSPGDCPMQNAFWNGSQMAYGAGFSQADDVVAHELTHAVTEHSAGLLYYYQSGALNESFSDMFGETVDLTNTGGTDTTGVRWLVGEDLPGLGAIRDMMHPNAFGDPGKVSDPQFFCHDQGWTDGGADSGGVHRNSGVPNHAFALMADGGTYNGRAISGLGIEKTGRVWYRALTVYLTSGAGFLDAYDAVLQSCSDLIGTAGITAANCTQVTLAVEAVEMQNRWNCGAAVQAPPLCPNAAAPAGTLLFVDFESGDGAFTRSNTGGSTNWVLTSGFAQSGSLSELGPNGGTTSDHRLMQTAGIALPAGARLYFDHAFEFESLGSTNYDGGVLEYSANGGASWTDAASLIDAGRDYSGSVFAGDTNPLGGRPAFVRQSFGYTATRLNLSALAGQTVQFRWRVGTDSIVGSLGWIVDNVRLYTCDGPVNGQMIENGDFSGGIGPALQPAGWQTFGLPSVDSGIQWNLSSNRFNYYRPPGSAQGVILQSTALAVPANTLVEAAWQMGNAGVGSGRKRYSVLIGDFDFTDLQVCTFWVDPGQAMQNYRMRTHTTRATSNLTIWFYAASINAVGDTTPYQLDNVSLTLQPTHSQFKTDCEDPLRPVAGGLTSANLVVNPEFDGGTILPWTPFGNLSHQLNGGVFEFFKLAGAPAGVILQATGQPMAVDQRMVASFQLGNSSNLRQRVTAILHDGDFSDLSACTFWLPPGLALNTYSMRAYASQAWTSATVAFYPATVGTAPSHQWLRLDGVTMHRTTSANWGTECYEPGANLLTNGSFERGPAIPSNASFTTVPGGSTVISGWLVTGGSIDYIGTAHPPSHGERAIDLDGAFSTGGIQQTFDTIPGTPYLVMFDLSGNPDGGPVVKHVRVSVDGVTKDFSFDTTGQSRTNLRWEPQSFTFVASGTTATVAFTSLSPGGNSWGALIDHASVTAQWMHLASIASGRNAGRGTWPD